jgi:valyl-tRNA synthetase
LKTLLTPFMRFNTAVWKYKKEKSMALSQEVVATFYVSRKLKVFEADLKAMHKIKILRYTRPPKKVKNRVRALDSDTFVVE